MEIAKLHHPQATATAAISTAIEDTAASVSATMSPPPTTTTTTTINIGTRKSVLALKQTDIVHQALQRSWPDLHYEIHAMSTMGDKNQVTPLHDFGAKSLWTHELEAGLLKGELDMVVHSLKDMPTQLPPSLKIGAILTREDPRDALVVKASLPYKSITDLPAGSVVGTSSVRRLAQIKRKYPHLDFADVRGNVGTRLSKLDAEDGKYACLVLASAGLKRLDLGHRITQHLESTSGGLLHAVGQGALGVEIREGDERTQELLSKLADRPTTLACLAERSLMRTLEGGCSVPIGVETTWRTPGEEQDRAVLVMKAVVVSLDGKDCVEGETAGEVESEGQADDFGRQMAKELVEKGAGKILEAITLNRDIVNA
ncbi:MAG: porphobilinogen deaminase [Caeruleum heppii]|nr:MAG: porphobilinogen deaminase [Caeruleum heppii]